MLYYVATLSQYSLVEASSQREARTKASHDGLPCKSIRIVRRATDEDLATYAFFQRSDRNEVEGHSDRR